MKRIKGGLRRFNRAIVFALLCLIGTGMAHSAGAAAIAANGSTTEGLTRVSTGMLVEETEPDKSMVSPALIGLVAGFFLLAALNTRKRRSNRFYRDVSQQVRH